MPELIKKLLSTPALLVCGMLVVLTACAPREAAVAQNETAPAPEEGVAFVVYDHGAPLAGVNLRLCDADGHEVSRSMSDTHGQVDLPRAEDGGKLILAAPGHKEREFTLPAGLPGSGGEVEYREVTAHKEFFVELPIISGTGYTWQLAPSADASLSKDETLHRIDNLPGSPAVQRLTLKPASVHGQVLLIYARSWEKDVPPEQWRVLLFEPGDG